MNKEKYNGTITTKIKGMVKSHNNTGKKTKRGRKKTAQGNPDKNRYAKAINLALGFVLVFVFLCLELVIVMSGIISTKKPINPQKTESSLTKNVNGASIDASSGTETENSANQNVNTQTDTGGNKTPSALSCETDADCTPLFSNCSCGYSCLNEEVYSQINRVSCNAICTQQEKDAIPSCLCRNNRCVKK
ncbi:MAG: hypothetical protein A3D92_10570 [Bacteroidetes bacterium RIFCSPHIGHO2_02_FULL_44_7]|nr:MAG: hypothetical protein A3D92_10570 [Bacteroidetes bacterium RIFCSPHIGHO2_02_FULL_44_7]